MRRKLAWTTTCYHRTNQKTRTSAWQVYRQHCKKPTLFSRISLGTLKGRGRRYSIATNQSHNFYHPSGSIYSVETPLTLTMSSQTSTHYPTAQAMSSNLGRTLNCSMDRRHQPKPSKLTGIGSSLGTVWLKPHSSCLNIKHRKSELLSYGKHIQRYFASLPPQFHSRVINYDRAARIRTAQCRAIELLDYALFTDLQIQWITNSPIAAGPSQTTETAKEPKEPTGKGKKGCQKAAYCRWNEGRCPNAAATCKYLHVCSKCSNLGHVASNCDAPGKK